MASLASLAGKRRARVMLVGWPKAGKTGSLVALANAGYKLRVLSFAEKMDPFYAFAKPDADIDIIEVADELAGKDRKIELKGQPTAFRQALKMLDHWRYTDENGQEVDLGRSRNWGPDTVLVVDSLTSMGDAALRNVLFRNNRNGRAWDSDIGEAMSDQDAFAEKLASETNGFHVILISHLKFVGPNDVRKGEEDITKQIKEALAEVVPTRIYPSALGRQLPPKIGRHFPTIILAENKAMGGLTKRVLITQPRPELDLGVPAKDVPKELPLETGMLDIFERITPGTKYNLDPANNPAPAAGGATEEKAK